MSLDTGKEVHGRVITRLPITQAVIDRVEQLAEKHSQLRHPTRALVFEWRLGQLVNDDPAQDPPTELPAPIQPEIHMGLPTPVDTPDLVPNLDNENGDTETGANEEGFSSTHTPTQGETEPETEPEPDHTRSSNNDHEPQGANTTHEQQPQGTNTDHEQKQVHTDDSEDQGATDSDDVSEEQSHEQPQNEYESNERPNEEPNPKATTKRAPIITEATQQRRTE